MPPSRRTTPVLIIIADESPSKVGWAAFRFAISGFLIPFIFITSTQLLMVDATVLTVLQAFITAAIGCLCLAASSVGFMLSEVKLWERIVLIAVGILLLDGGIITDVIGLVVFGVLFFLNRRRAAGSAAAA